MANASRSSSLPEKNEQWYIEQFITNFKKTGPGRF